MLARYQFRRNGLQFVDGPSRAEGCADLHSHSFILLPGTFQCVCINFDRTAQPYMELVVFLVRPQVKAENGSIEREKRVRVYNC